MIGGLVISPPGGATGAASITSGTISGLTSLSSAAITATTTSLGTTPTAGATLVNTTAAAAGAQQVSPGLVWTGQGWKTNATAASQQVDFKAYVLPVQGSSAPTGTWTLQSAINGGAFSTVLGVSSSGAVTLAGDLYGPSSANLNIYGHSGNLGFTIGQFQSNIYGGNTETIRVQNGNATFYANVQLSGGNPGVPDVILARDAANVPAFRNSTTAQTFRVYGTYTDASNYVRAAINTTSTTVTLAAETAGTGADDIDITLTPAGTGTLKFGTHSALAAETVTGYITIKDSGGTTRKLAVVS